MDTSTVLELVKARLGISTTARDSYITSIIDGVIAELEEEKGLLLDGNSPHHLMFVVDYATWRYQSVKEPFQTSEQKLPRHLQFRLHNLVISQGDEDDI